MIEPITKICTFLLTIGLMMATAGAKTQSVIPIPLRMGQGSGTLLLTGDTKLYANLKSEEKKISMDYLEILPIHFEDGRKQTKDSVVSLVITKVNPQSSSPESYTLEVTPHKITAQATSGAGLFYGVQALLQVAQPATGDTWSVRATTIQDSPRFEYRGLILGASRHFRSKEFVKKRIDALAYCRLNRLYLHFTDATDQRIEIKKYPLLTEPATWHPETNWKKWWNEGGRKYCRSDAPGASGGYYAQDDICELVSHARERYITIIPEIEIPAHSEETLTAYPELSCSGEFYRNVSFCVGSEKTFTFLEDVLTEAMEFFPSQYIHIGGDEAGKAAWKTCPKCQKRMKDRQLDNVDELQSYLIHRMEVFLNIHSRKLLGWDETLQGGLALSATVMSWRGKQGGIDAVKSDHQAITTPDLHCYINSYQDAPCSQPKTIGGYLLLEKAYSYSPIPASLASNETKLIYGVQANLWAEYIQTDEYCEYAIYLHILALAEVARSAPEWKSWTGFRPRALKTIGYLRLRGYHPFDLKEKIDNRSEVAQSIQHLALSKTVKYNASYSSSYPTQGDKTLTDGVRRSWIYSDGAWQGFISRDRLDAAINMGESTDLHLIGADLTQVVGPEVFLPVEVIIPVSEDGEDSTGLSRRTHEAVESDAAVLKNYAWSGNAKGRYIRYQARAGREFGG